MLLRRFWLHQLRPRGRSALGHDDGGRTQDPVRDLVAGVQDLHDDVGGSAWHVHLDHGLVHVRIEFLAQGIEAGDAVALQHLEQVALGDFHAFQQRFHRRMGVERLLLRGLDGPPQIVADGDSVAGEFGNGVFRGIRFLTLRAPPQILHLGNGPQEPVPKLRILGLEFRDLLSPGLSALRALRR